MSRYRSPGRQKAPPTCKYGRGSSSGITANEGLPWGALGTARAVLEHAARLHTLEPDADALEVLSGWDYESELRSDAALTLVHSPRAVDQFERLHRAPSGQIR
jgi:hypothetical protein